MWFGTLGFMNPLSSGIQNNIDKNKMTSIAI